MQDPLQSASPLPPDLPLEEEDDLYFAFQRLRLLFMMTLAGLVLFGVGVNLYIGKQMRMLQYQLNTQRPLIGKKVADFHKLNEPIIRSFVGQIEGYALTHRELTPVLEKYRLVLGKYYTRLPAPGTRPPGTNAANRVGTTNP